MGKIKITRSQMLFAMQIFFIAIFFITGPVIAGNTILFAIQLAAVTLGFWALIIMSKKSKISALPDIKKGAKLLVNGPYRYTRNPMYTSIIFAMLPSLLAGFSLLRLLIFLAEVYVLLQKIKMEEKLLDIKFPEYKKYKSSTYKLIPFVY